MSYQPSQEIVERYAKVLVDFALADGRGIEPGEVVYVIGAEEAGDAQLDFLPAGYHRGIQDDCDRLV